MNCLRWLHPSSSKTLKKHYDLFIIFPDSWTNLQTFKPVYNDCMPKRYFARFGQSYSYTMGKWHPSLYRRILAVLRRQRES